MCPNEAKLGDYMEKKQIYSMWWTKPHYMVSGTFQNTSNNIICFLPTVIFLIIYRQDDGKLSKIALSWVDLQKIVQIKGNKPFHFHS